MIEFLEQMICLCKACHLLHVWSSCNFYLWTTITYHLSFFVIYRRPFLQIFTLTILSPLVLGINQCKRHMFVPYIILSLYLSEPVSCLAQYSPEGYCGELHIVVRRCDFWQIGLIQNKPNFRKQCLSQNCKNMCTDYRFLIHLLNRLKICLLIPHFLVKKSYCNWPNFEKERFCCFSVTSLIHLF